MAVKAGETAVSHPRPRRGDPAHLREGPAIRKAGSLPDRKRRGAFVDGRPLRASIRFEAFEKTGASLPKGDEANARSARCGRFSLFGDRAGIRDEMGGEQLHAEGAGQIREQHAPCRGGRPGTGGAGESPPRAAPRHQEPLGRHTRFEQPRDREWQIQQN